MQWRLHQTASQTLRQAVCVCGGAGEEYKNKLRQKRRYANALTVEPILSRPEMPSYKMYYSSISLRFSCKQQQSVIEAYAQEMETNATKPFKVQLFS